MTPCVAESLIAGISQAPSDYMEARVMRAVRPVLHGRAAFCFGHFLPIQDESRNPEVHADITCTKTKPFRTPVATFANLRNGGDNVSVQRIRVNSVETAKA